MVSLMPSPCYGGGRRLGCAPARPKFPGPASLVSAGAVLFDRVRRTAWTNRPLTTFETTAQTLR